MGKWKNGSTILDWVLMEVVVQFHPPVTLLPEKSPRYKLDRRLDGSQSRSERCEERNISCPV
jgi:hypothetical protein